MGQTKAVAKNVTLTIFQAPCMGQTSTRKEQLAQSNFQAPCMGQTLSYSLC